MKSLKQFITEFSNIFKEPLHPTYEDYCKYFGERDEMIFETLLFSYSLNKFEKDLYKYFKKHIFYTAISNKRDEENNLYYDIKVCFKPGFDFENKRYKSLINFYNLYEAESKTDKNGKHIWFKQDKTKDMTEKIYSEHKYLYHITKSIYLDKILKYGLQPKSKTKNNEYHPYRVYLLPDTTPYRILMNYKKLLDGDVILKIDLSKLPKMNIFDDSDTPNIEAYYCENFIPPSCISVVGKVSEFLMKIFNKG